MKITVKQLRTIIKEEVGRVLLREWEQSLVRRGDKVFLVDDEGNREFYGYADSCGVTLEDGESVPFEGKGIGRSEYQSSYSKKSTGPYMGWYGMSPRRRY